MNAKIAREKNLFVRRNCTRATDIFIFTGHFIPRGVSMYMALLTVGVNNRVKNALLFLSDLKTLLLFRALDYRF